MADLPLAKKSIVVFGVLGTQPDGGCRVGSLASQELAIGDDAEKWQEVRVGALRCI